MNRALVVQAKSISSVVANLPKHIKVAIGVIIQNERYFVCRRQAHQHQGNKWEFPGGKLHADECPQDALARELREEVGITVENHQHLMDFVYDYPDKTVSLFVFIVDKFSDQAFGAEGQESKWVSFEELIKLSFPDANQSIIDKLIETRA